MNNPILENIRTRRSVRKYKEAQITEDELNTVLEAGTYAPSGRGLQSPILVAVQEPETKKRLIKMNAEILGTDTDPYYGAPTLILVFAPVDRTTCIEDGSCVLDTMMLAAHSIGLASCWIHREKEMFATTEGKALMKKWGVPENFNGIGALALGYADGPLPQAPQRKEGRIIRI